MVRPVQLQQAEKHGEIRTTGTAGVRFDQDRRARGAVPRAERLAVVDRGTNVTVWRSRARCTRLTSLPNRTRY